MKSKICTCKYKCYWKAYHFWGLTSLFYHSMNFKGFSHPSFKRRVSDSMWNYLWCEREGFFFLKSTLLALQERLFCHSNIIATFKNSLYSRLHLVFHLKKVKSSLYGYNTGLEFWSPKVEELKCIGLEDGSGQKCTLFSVRTIF